MSKTSSDTCCDTTSCSSTTNATNSTGTKNCSSDTTVDASSSSTKANATLEIQELTQQQEIGALRAAHSFFSNFDNVPGHAAAQWGQALDAIAVVANSLIKKTGALDSSGQSDTATTDSEQDSTNSATA